MRKMADKLGHITSPRPASAGANSPSSSSAQLSGAQPIRSLPQAAQAQEPHSPSPSLSSTQSTALSSAGYRPSISTERTSVSEWKSSSNNNDALQEKQPERMDVDAPAEPLVPLQVRRQTGSYRLSDFIIHRTLGTGSFGRVHLGTCPVLLACSA